MNELIKLIEQWAKDKDLDKAEPTKQYLKVSEEVGEIAASLARDNMIELKDAIGDTVVTLIILALQNGLSLEACLAAAYDEIKDRKGKTINGVFVKESDLTDVKGV